MTRGQSSLALLITILVACSLQSVLGGCYDIDHTTDRCRSASYIKVQSPQGPVKIYKGNPRWVNFGNHWRTETNWFCGSSKERVAWSGSANRIHVSFYTDGTIQWTVSWVCDQPQGCKVWSGKRLASWQGTKWHACIVSFPGKKYPHCKNKC